MAFVRQQPVTIFSFQNNRKMVTILKKEGSENPVPIDALRFKLELFAHFFTKIAFYAFQVHAKHPRTNFPAEGWAIQIRSHQTCTLWPADSPHIDRLVGHR